MGNKFLVSDYRPVEFASEKDARSRLREVREAEGRLTIWRAQAVASLLLSNMVGESKTFPTWNAVADEMGVSPATVTIARRTGRLLLLGIDPNRKSFGSLSAALGSKEMGRALESAEKDGLSGDAAWDRLAAAWDAEKKRSQKKDDAPKDDEKKDDAPKDDAPKDDEKKDDAPKDDAPKDDEKKDDAPKDDAPKDDAPKDDEKKDDAPEVPKDDEMPTGTPRPSDPPTAPRSVAAALAEVERLLAWVTSSEKRRTVSPSEADRLATIVAMIDSITVGGAETVRETRTA